MEEEKEGTLDVRHMALKCTTKSEVYMVLTISGGIYLPPVEQTNCDFIRDIISGDKLYVTCNDVKIMHVPHIEGLRIPDILALAKKYCSIDKYMPVYKCDKYPFRKWICNVVSSLIYEKFKQIVNEKLTESNDKNDLMKGNKFPVVPAIAKIFTDTKFLSKRRGRFHQLVKNSKRKREESAVDANREDKEKELSKYIDVQDEEIDNLKSELEDHFNDTEILKRLYENGYIDVDGKPTNRYSDMKQCLLLNAYLLTTSFIFL